MFCLVSTDMNWNFGILNVIEVAKEARPPKISTLMLIRGSESLIMPC